MSYMTHTDYIDVFNGDTKKAQLGDRVNGFSVVSVAEEGLASAQEKLRDIRGGWQFAVGSALARAARSGKTAAKQAIAKEYTLSQSEFLRRTYNINHFQGLTTVIFGFRGNVIPLTKYQTRVDNHGRVVVHVKRSRPEKELNHAFKVQVGNHGHVGIFERTSPKRLPISELFGPATPQMIRVNPEVHNIIEAKTKEVFLKRIDHEVYRVLNGWGARGSR